MRRGSRGTCGVFGKDKFHGGKNSGLGLGVATCVTTGQMSTRGEQNCLKLGPTQQRLYLEKYSVYWDIRTPVIPDSWPVRTWIQLTDVFSYINVISIADSRHWHLRTRKSGENRLKMTQKWPKTTTKKTKLVNFFYRLFPLVTNRYHPTDCFELAMLPAGKYSHGKLWNSGEDFLGTYTRCH